MIPNIGRSRDSNDELVIKPSELKKKIDDGDDFFILDVRTKQEHDLWSISYDKYQDSTLIPVDTLMQSESLKKIPKDKEIIAFCAHGQRSSMAAMALSSLGYNVKTVEGGMDGWSNLYDIAEVNVEPSLPLIIWQVRRISKGCMSYIITSKKDGSTTIIDPTCNIDGVIDNIIKERDIKVERVIDTHLHADHLSGSSKIAAKYNSELILSSYENYTSNEISNELQKVKLVHGNEVFYMSDSFNLQAIHTPGHTQGSISYVLSNNINLNDVSSNSKTRGADYSAFHYLFPGDTIFVNGVGRPDLHNKAQEYTSLLFQTYKNYIFELPNNTILLPSHYSESFDHGKAVYNTIDFIRNKLSAISGSIDDFYKYVNSNIPPQPMNYERIVKLNRSLVQCDQVHYRDLEAGPNSCGIMA